MLARSVRQRARREPHLHARLPAGRPVRAPGRLLVHRERPPRPRAVPQRRADRQGERVRVDPRRAREPRPRGQRRGHEPRRGGHRRRRRRPRRAQGRGGGDRAADRQGARDGLDPGVRPEPDPDQLRAHQHRPQQAAPEPHHAGAVPARLDLQGGDRHRGARHRQGHARTRSSTAPRQGRSAACRSRTSAARTSARSRSPTRSPTRSTPSSPRSASGSAPRRSCEYMKRFGFFEDPQLDYPGRPDGPERRSGASGSTYVEDGFDVGRVAIGQGGDEGALDTTRCRWRRWPPRSPTGAA